MTPPACLSKSPLMASQGAIFVFMAWPGRYFSRPKGQAMMPPSMTTTLP